MIITTALFIEGKTIVEQRGIVCKEIISGVDFIKDIAAGMRNFFGGRAASQEAELIMAREAAINEMMERADQRGANAVVGVDLDYEVLGNANNMLMVTAQDTAVIVR